MSSRKKPYLAVGTGLSLGCIAPLTNRLESAAYENNLIRDIKFLGPDEV